MHPGRQHAGVFELAHVHQFFDQVASVLIGRFIRDGHYFYIPDHLVFHFQIFFMSFMAFPSMHFKFHHDVGLLLVAQLENMFVKFDETVFPVKTDRSRVFLPNAQPYIINPFLLG